MADYRIITDSTTDLSEEMVKELDVQVVPLHFTIDGKTYGNYPDERELSSTEFYRKLRAGQQSTTAQINPEMFVEIFKPILEAGEDILYVGFSSGLSGTFQASQFAAEELKSQYPERKIYCVDTLAASMGEGLLVFYAANMKKDGASIDDIKSWLDENILKLAHWFTVDDLFHLKRGGRVSAAAAVFGSMLNIKPVLHVDDEGHLIPFAKARGRRKSLDFLVEKMDETAIDAKNQTVFISHADAIEDAEYVRDQIQKKLGVKNFRINFIGPVIGSHAGPGTIALFFIAEHR